MKKAFGYYTIGWFISVLLFHLMTFLVGGHLRQTLDAGFWVGYVFILIAFFGLIFIAYRVFNSENAQKLFYRIPLMRIAKVGLVLTLLVGSVFMAVPGLPAWIGAVLCLLILGFNGISLLKASAAADIVEDIDDKIATDTAFIRALTADAQCLYTKTTNPNLRKMCKDVYEVVRYTDPMSHPSLNFIENQISRSFDAFAEAVSQEKEEAAGALANEIKGYITDRSENCKILKAQQ